MQVYSVSTQRFDTLICLFFHIDQWSVQLDFHLVFLHISLALSTSRVESHYFPRQKNIENIYVALVYESRVKIEN